MSLKSELHHYLNQGRTAVLWKLEGLSEYDARRPLTPTGTNLLGLVKHLAIVESGYFGGVFGRPYPKEALDPAEDEENSDMWATEAESMESVIDFYRHVQAHSDATIEALDLDAPGSVPWWPEERRAVTLHKILIHMATETHRHAGHADIVRELIDGAVGHRPGTSNLPDEDRDWWRNYVANLERIALRFK
ncbi:DinB family protein [Saccharothrix obliqua]|uniref:DinB family protein n=1 Tax=Saccharothrix obliqua TaxID=2861747 RepID=UPI001C5EC106|nr:DinB family protein [Saccharothrix obliqua]MBW4716472.1 DinB family protein [Saccharothrix obliqua]